MRILCHNTIWLYSCYRFIVNSDTGDISTRQPLDYETQKRYLLLLVARDSAPDVRSATATVTVNVGDLPDAIPIFRPVSYEVKIDENLPPGTLVQKVLVS